LGENDKIQFSAIDNILTVNLYQNGAWSTLITVEDNEYTDGRAGALVTGIAQTGLYIASWQVASGIWHTDNNDAFITRHWTGSGYLKSDGTADTPSGTISGPATVTAGHIATWTDNVTLADSGYAAPDQALSITDNVTHHDGTFTGTLTAAGWSSSATDNTHTLIVNNTGTVDNAYRQANGIWTQSDNTVHMISSDNTSEAIVAVFNRILSRIAWKLSGSTFDNVVVPMLPSGNGAVVTGFKGIFYDNSAGTISTAATDNVTVEVDYCLGASCTNIDNTTLTGAAPADITIAGTATIPTNADIRYRFTAVNTSGKFSIAVVGRWQ